MRTEQRTLADIIILSAKFSSLTHFSHVHTNDVEIETFPLEIFQQ